MENQKIENIDKIIKSLMISSDNNYEEMMDFFNIKRYNWALFVGHLCLEKLLKAYHVKINKQHSLNLHNLIRIAELSELKLDNSQKTDFAAITSFNIATRYDDYKQDFYNKCNKEFAEDWINKIKEYREWIKELIKL